MYLEKSSNSSCNKAKSRVDGSGRVALSSSADGSARALERGPVISSTATGVSQTSTVLTVASAYTVGVVSCTISTSTIAANAIEGRIGIALSSNNAEQS